MMVSDKQHETIKRLLDESASCPGDVVEVGCNEGSTSELLAEWINGSGRSLHLFDSFEGLPEESGYGGLMAAGQAVLEDRIATKTGSPELPSFVHVYPGWFVDTIPSGLPDRIAFAFIDCDVFESMIDSVPEVEARLTGVMAIHDYTHDRWGAGVRRAVQSMCLKFEIEDGMAIVRGPGC